MRLIRDNVERIAATKEQEALLIRQGFRPVGSPEAEPEKTCEAETGLTVKELRALAKKKGVKGASSLTRDELLAALKE